MTEEDWTLHRLLSEVVGSGPKSATDMNRAQARAAFRQILEGDPDPTTLGAFLLANRWKRNTPEELAAYVDVMMETSVTSTWPDTAVVDCGANYDGKVETALLGVAAGLVAAAAGTPVVTHSADRVPTKHGATYNHVLSHLGVPTDLDPAASARMVEQTGFGYYYQPRFNPGVHALLDRRDAMGVRTAINTIETLANPAGASVHVGSFYHLAFAKKLIETIDASEALAVDRAVLFQGLEGYDDIRPGHTTVAEWDGSTVEDYAIETPEYGMDFDEDVLAVDDVPGASARLTREVLTAERTDAAADAVCLNAAVRLYAGGRVDDLDDGIDLARKTIADGRAAAALDSLQDFEPAPQRSTAE